MSAIEQAVARGVPYTGEDPADGPDISSTGTPDQPDADADPAEAGSGQPGSDPDPAEAGADPAETAYGPVATDAAPAGDGADSTADGDADPTDDRGEDSGQAVA